MDDTDGRYRALLEKKLNKIVELFCWKGFQSFYSSYCQGISPDYKGQGNTYYDRKANIGNR